MYLKVSSPDGLIYDGEIKRAVIPTEEWEIGIHPWHIPLASVVSPWVVRIIPKEEKKDEMIKSKKYIFENDELNISVSKWLIFVDGETISIVTSSATSSPEQTKEVLEEMKNELEWKVESLKENWEDTELEKTIISLGKVKADMKLLDKSS